MSQLLTSIQLNSLFYLIFGLFFLFDPRKTLGAFIWLFAAFFAIFGIINLTAALRVRSQTGIYDVGLSIGIFQLILAALILVFAKPLLAFIPIIDGITLIILGVSEVIDAFSRKQYINVVLLPMVVYGIILILVGILLTFNPFKTVLVLLQFFGAILIMNAIMDLVGIWRWR